jgi:hypothetical protein
MNSKHLAAFAAVAALAAPTAAFAGAGHGKSDEAKAQHQATNKGQAKPKNAVFKGTVVSADVVAGTVTIHVDKTNKWGRGFKGTDVSFTVAGVKKVIVADTNADGKADLADVKAGDSAKAQAKITTDAVPPLAARKLKVAAPAPAEPDDD